MPAGSSKLSLMASPPPALPPEPHYSLSDRLAIALACIAGVIGIVIAVALFFAEKTPAFIVLLALLMLGLSIYPVLRFFRRNLVRVVVLVAVVVLAAVFVLQELRYRSHAEQPSSASSTPQRGENTSPTPPSGPTEQPARIGDYPSIELRPAIPRIEFSFLSSGDKR